MIQVISSVEKQREQQRADSQDLDRSCEAALCIKQRAEGPASVFRGFLYGRGTGAGSAVGDCFAP